jgi:hypothetical protein
LLFLKIANKGGAILLLENCAIVSQGVILSRIQTLPGPDAESIPLYTMKEFNQSLGLSYHGRTEKLQKVHVPRRKIEELLVTKEGMVLINLTAHKAVTIRPEHVGKVITSNFVSITPSSNLNSLYFEWFFNEHPDCQRQLRIATQGSIVSALSIQMLRSLQLHLPSLKDQEMMGKVYRFTHDKKRLTNERLQLEEQLTNHLLLWFLKEET